MTIWLDYKFLEQTDFPRQRFGKIYVTYHNVDLDGEICLSARCATLGELEYHVNKLIDDLEKIRRKARRTFAASDLRRAQRRLQVLPIED